MYVKLGPYKSWVGPYQIAKLFRYVGFSEDTCHDGIGDWLANTWVKDACEYIYSKRERTIKVQLHDYDTWNLDGTLALIIAPCLKQLRETAHGSCSNIDPLDVPEDLRCPSEELDPVFGVPHKYLHTQWDWILKEMIWAFETIINDDYYELSEEQLERQAKGLIMFGKYYRALWD